MGFWQWLEEHHPILYEVIWAFIVAMALASLVISTIALVQ